MFLQSQACSNAAAAENVGSGDIRLKIIHLGTDLLQFLECVKKVDLEAWEEKMHIFHDIIKPRSDAPYGNFIVDAVGRSVAHEDHTFVLHNGRLVEGCNHKKGVHEKLAVRIDLERKI